MSPLLPLKPMPKPSSAQSANGQNQPKQAMNDETQSVPTPNDTDKIWPDVYGACPVCGGMGTLTVPPNPTVKCPDCEGSGIQPKEQSPAVQEMVAFGLAPKLADAIGKTLDGPQVCTNPVPFVDTPLLKAKRRAFDHPSQLNLGALILEAGMAATAASEQREAEMRNRIAELEKEKEELIQEIGSLHQQIPVD